MPASFASITVSDLLVDLSNPRLDVQTNQRDAIRTVAKDQGPKLIRLCRDIVEQKGMNPLDRFLVLPQTGGKYVVLEGNRRLVALKILDNPTLVDGALTANLSARLKRLALRYDKSPVTHIDCAIVQKREEAGHWLELRHTGENKGAGTVPWKSAASTNFKNRFGKPAAHISVLAYMRSSPHVSSRVKALIDDVAVTNIERLLGDPYVRGRLGLEKERGTGRVLTTHSDKEIAHAFEQIVEDFTTGGKTVAHIDNKALRKTYIDTLHAVLPDPTAAGSVLREIGAKSAKPSVSGDGATKPVKPIKPPKGRRVLIPKTFVLRIENEPRLNAIYYELQSLDIGEHRNAVAVLFRTFLEMCLDSYYERESVPIGKNADWQHMRLFQKAEAVEQHMVSAAILTKDQLKPFRVMFDKNQKDSYTSLNTLNAYVHNRHHTPTESELTDTWNRVAHVFKKLWE